MENLFESTSKGYIKSHLEAHELERIDKCLQKGKKPFAPNDQDENEDMNNASLKRRKKEKNVFCGHCENYVTNRVFKSHQEN